MPGPFELIIILAIVVILFGVGKLPKVLGQMGKGVKAFKEGVSGTDGDDGFLDATPNDPPSTMKAIDADVVSETEAIKETASDEEESA